jgi:hypothetical protein
MCSSLSRRRGGGSESLLGPRRCRDDREVLGAGVQGSVARGAEGGGMSVKTNWRGDLNDDCTLERYGLFAHVERMDRKRWWFAVYPSRNGDALYNSADPQTAIRLRDGDAARAAAEHVMEVLNPQRVRRDAP